jgi:hypothetical protein
MKLTAILLLIAHSSLFYFIALLSSQTIFGQSGWTLINAGSGITNMSAVDTSFVFASGGGGLILKSTNGGLN